MPGKRRVAQRARLARVVPSKYSYDKPGPFGRAGRFLGGLGGGLAGGALGAALHAAAMADPLVGPVAQAAILGGAGAKKFAVGGGAAAGKALGSKLGSYAHYIGKIFGSGDYVTASDGVRANSLVSRDLSGHQAPQFGGSREVRIRHREYLGDILTSATAGAFNIQQFPVNPGLAKSFPWLSQVCGATFQQYRLNGMVFEFRSMSSDALNSTNTALGSVVMATDYDSKDAPFTTKQQMENTMFGVSCKPSSCMIHAIECARSQTSVSELYIRAYDVPSGADVRLYDMGNFYIATQGGQAANVNLGELWVSYDVTLLKEIEQVPGYLNSALHYNLAPTAAAPLTLDVTVNATQPVYNSLPSAPISISTTVLNLPLSLQTNSEYMVIYLARGGSTASCVPPAVTFAGGLSSASLPGGGLWINGTSTGFTFPQAVNTSTAVGLCIAFAYNGSGTLAVPPSITFGTAGTYPSACSGDLWIIQVSSVAK